MAANFGIIGAHSISASLYNLGRMNAYGKNKNPAPNGQARIDIGTSSGGEGMTVDVGSGNLALQDQDALAVSLGNDASSTRTYNSQGKFSDWNDDAWLLVVEK